MCKSTEYTGTIYGGKRHLCTTQTIQHTGQSRLCKAIDPTGTILAGNRHYTQPALLYIRGTILLLPLLHTENVKRSRFHHYRCSCALISHISTADTKLIPGTYLLAGLRYGDHSNPTPLCFFHPLIRQQRTVFLFFPFSLGPSPDIFDCHSTQHTARAATAAFLPLRTRCS